MPDSGSSDPSYQLNARLLRYRSRPGGEEPIALVEDLLNAGRFGDARGVAVLEQSEHPEDVRFVLLEGRAWIQERDLARAQAVLLRGIKVDPRSADAFRWLGFVLLERGDNDRAGKAVQRGLSIDGRDTELLRLQARITRSLEAPSAGLVIDMPAESAGVPEPTVRSRVTAAPPARVRSVTPKEVTPPAAPPARARSTTPKDVAVPPAPAVAPSIAPPVAQPVAKIAVRPGVPSKPPVAIAPREDTKPAMPKRSVTPPKARPAAVVEARARDNTLQGLFGAGASLPKGTPIAERRAGGTLPFPSSVPTPAPLNAPIATPAPTPTMRPPKGGTTPGLLDAPRASAPRASTPPVRTFEPPARESLGESLERVEITPRARDARPSNPAGTVPGLIASPLVHEPAVTRNLSWDDEEDDVDELPTGDHEPIERQQSHAFEATIDAPRADASVLSHDEAPTFDYSAYDAPLLAPSPTTRPAARAHEIGAVGNGAPDLALGSDAGGTEDVDGMLDMLRRQGIFEPPTGTTSPWANRKDIPRTGTKLTTVLLAVWIVTLGLSVGGYFGWQHYVSQRHAEAVTLTQGALAGIATGEHEALVDADRNLRLAHEAHPNSAQVAQTMLLLQSVRALDDGTGDASALRATLAGVGSLVSRLKEAGASTNVSPAYIAAATATSSALSGDLAAARTAMTTALANVGNDFMLHYWVGRIAQRIGEPSASEELNAAIEGDPKLLAALLAVADLEREAGQTEQAMAHVQQVRDKQPKHLRARLWHAYFAADQEAPAEALAALDVIAKDLDRGAPADRVVEAVTRARLMRRSGKLDEAGEVVANALKLGATDPRLLALVAEEARRGGKLGVAQMAASQAVSGAPSVAAYRRLLADVLIDRQDGARALTILEQLSSDDPEVLVMRAKAALLLGTTDALSQVGAALDAYVAANPSASVRVKALRIRARVQLEPTPAVLKEAEKLSKDAPGDPDALLALGEAALELHEGAIADRALSSLVKVAPESARAYYLLGRVKRLNGDADAAEENLRKTLELASNHTEALIALGSLLLDRAKYADADALYQELSTRSGEAHYGRLGRVEALIGLGKLDDAQVQWEGVPERFRDSAAARQTGARLALARSKPGEAITLLQPLTQGDDRRAPVMALYGDALYAADQVDAAAGAYDAALAIDSGLPEALVGRGEVEVRAEKPDDALEHLIAAQASLKARIRPPELAARVWLLTGRAYIQRNKRGDMEEARKVLVQATAIEGVRPVAFFWLGESWAGKNTPEARAAYERYMALQPEGEFAGRARKALSVR